MTEFLRHRGPDDAGICAIQSESGEIRGTFGHRRLAIIDLSPLGHQPMFSADGNLCITYNGEIYNYLDLRRELADRGAHFKSSSDTEVILEGWQRDGVDFLRRMRGMFAIAIWDKAADRGYFIRDAFGIKPLYNATVDGGVLFASEVRALLETEMIPRSFSKEAVRSFLATGSVSEPLTIVDGVTAVPPGSVVEIVRDGERFAPGQTVRFASPLGNAAATGTRRKSYPALIREALRESVQYHLVSDVPVAVFLSGGIDSSAVAGLAAEVSSSPIDTFTVVFEEASFSEASKARASAQKFGTRHHEVALSGNDLLDALPDAFEAMDQPSLDGLNTFVVSRAVKSFGLKVALSGLGGDELFGGYPSFKRAQRIAPLFKLPSGVRHLVASGVGTFAEPRAARVKMLLNERNASHAAYVGSRTLFDDSMVGRLMGEPMTRPPSNEPDNVDTTGMTLAQKVSLYEVTGYMRNTLLRDSDVFSMAHGLEIRVPMLDSAVASIAHEAAPHMQSTNGAIKPMLTEAVKDLLPPGVDDTPKMGFTLPFEAWMRREMMPEVESVLGSDFINEISIESRIVREVWDGFLSRKSGLNWSRPWALYTLARWAQTNGMESRTRE